ncbi:MAG TPA: SCO family protein [bacterium]|nr:SCO family protein [bacterium]
MKMWRFAWAAVALIVVIGAALWGRARFAPPSLEGAVLTPPVRAYGFQLPDQDGRPVSLAALRGRVVALTFLYTHCPDYCPLIADQINAAHAQLARLGDRVAFVAVSVDPSGDTPEAIRGFLEAHHVRGVLTYLRGTAAQLRPVWAHYFVASDAKDGVSAGAGGGQGVNHTTIVYIIDPQGLVRVFLPANFDLKDLVTDVRLLARTAR